jgi:hypothetical protein
VLPYILGHVHVASIPMGIILSLSISKKITQFDKGMEEIWGCLVYKGI